MKVVRYSAVTFRFLPPLLLSLVLSVGASAQRLAAVRLQTMSGEKFGYQNAAGAVVIKPRFEAASDFQDGCARVCIGGRCGLIDSTGREIAALKFKDIGYFHDGLAGVSLDGRKYGYLNRAGVLVIPYAFDEVTDFSEGRAAVALNGRAALINKAGTLLTPYKYLRIEPMQGGIARVCVRNDSRDGIEHSNFWGFINVQGKEISKLTCYGSESPNLGNGYAVTRIATPDGRPTTIKTAHYTFLVGKTYNYNSALIDKTGRVVIPSSAGYEFGSWTDSYLRVKKDKFYEGVVDYTGKVVLPVNFWNITEFEFGPDGKSLAKAFTSERGFFYVDKQFKCVAFDGVKCPEY
ncbi:WG repeat-containing protein [Hymenobacter armeniacus]|uniref:WG repeat-containing protein n=1 Tax=Hymenobacter armeniacus TaxID=2771358 RepID=A0ABR8JQH1_9BACT|nr:WG repeat-containing protein [Hymenobacter armeniacus]MBD2722209.1 WG repeat-containing protein [Hymenobacter armeniacus]